MFDEFVRKVTIIVKMYIASYNICVGMSGKCPLHTARTSNQHCFRVCSSIYPVHNKLSRQRCMHILRTRVHSFTTFTQRTLKNIFESRKRLSKTAVCSCHFAMGNGCVHADVYIMHDPGAACPFIPGRHKTHS